MLTAIKLETLARHYWMTRQLGPPVLLTDAEMQEVKTRYQHYGHARMAG